MRQWGQVRCVFLLCVSWLQACLRREWVCPAQTRSFTLVTSAAPAMPASTARYQVRRLSILMLPSHLCTCALRNGLLQHQSGDHLYFQIKDGYLQFLFLIWKRTNSRPCKHFWLIKRTRKLNNPYKNYSPSPITYSFMSESNQISTK